MSHPNSLDLEAFACGDETDAVRAHVDACDACRAFVSDLRGLPAPTGIDVASIARRETRRRLYAGVSIALPLAAAAVLLLFLRAPRPPETSGAPVGPLPVVPAETVEPSTSFKGVRQVAVIRERDGRQERFTHRVPVRDGDRLRVEVAIDREQAILAAVIGDDGSYLELMPSAVRTPGTHYSEKSARVSGPPSGGTIVVGTEEQIARARQHVEAADLSEIRVDWEAP